MNKSSIELFNYALRPAKNMERKMFCEALSRLSRIDNLARYRYVGFGGLGFHDFCLFHQRLGINDMLSIEGYLNAQIRISKNKPYSCIRMKWGMSHDILPTLKWNKRTILWLDYERPIDEKKIEDLMTACASLRSGSALIITLPADPGTVVSGEDMNKKRLDDLRSRVGKDNLPGDVQGSDLSKWGLATVLRRIVVNIIEKYLNQRSAALEEHLKLKFEQLFHFHYADGTRMMSVGGLVLNAEDRSKLAPKHFKDLTFYRPGADSYLIDCPLLTLREIKLLDGKLPRTAPDVARPSWIPEPERKKYGKVYRYFPSFSEVES